MCELKRDTPCHSMVAGTTLRYTTDELLSCRFYSAGLVLSFLEEENQRNINSSEKNDVIERRRKRDKQTAGEVQRQREKESKLKQNYTPGRWRQEELKHKLASNQSRFLSDVKLVSVPRER